MAKVIFGQKINIFEFGFFSKIIPLKRGSRLGIKIDGFFIFKENPCYAQTGWKWVISGSKVEVLHKSIH